MDDNPAIIRILLADRHTLIREGLRALAKQQPDMKVVGRIWLLKHLRQVTDIDVVSVWKL